MKKLLAILLAILMVIPATLVPVSAVKVTTDGVETNNCCEVLVTNFTNKNAFGDVTAVDKQITVGMLDGYQAVSLTSVSSSSHGGAIKLAYYRAKDTGLDASADISGMTHIAFDLYISDASKLIDQQKIFFELTSAGTSDKEERCLEKTLESVVGKTLVNGWNHVEIALNTFGASGTGTFDATAWDFFRIYNSGSFPGGVTFGLANMYFFNADCEEHYSHAKYQFCVLDKQEGYDEECNYLVQAGSKSTDGTYYFNDGTRETIYRFDGIDTDRISSVTLTATLSAQLKVSVAKAENGPWAPVYIFKTTAMEQLVSVGLTASENISLWQDADGTKAWFKGSETARGEALSDDKVAGVDYLKSKVAAGTVEGFDTASATYAGIKFNPASLSQLSTTGLTLDLTEALNTIPGDSDQIYFKIGDSYTSSGWGGSIRGVVTLNVRYDESIPKFVENTVEYSFEVLRASEGAYLFEDTSNVGQNSSRNNYVRYGDRTAYFTYRYPLGNAQNADALYFTATTQGQLSLKVSTDNSTWVDAYAASTILSKSARSYDLLTALKSASNTATTADYLYVRIGDATTGDGNGGGLASYATATLRATVNDNVDVRAYEDDSFLLFTEGEQSHIVYDDSYGQASANGSYNTNTNASGQINTQTLKLNNVDTLTTRQMTHSAKVTGANNVDMGSWLLDESPNGNANNANKYAIKFNDGTRRIQYQYQVSLDHLLAADRLTYHAFMANEILIQLSVDGGVTWPYTLYNDASTTADRMVTIDLLSFDGLREALIAAGGAFQLKISDANTANGWGAKIIGYGETIIPTDTGDKTSITISGNTKEVTVCNFNSYPSKPYAVSMTMEYDANTAGQTMGTVVNEFNYVGEPIYRDSTEDDKATYPYLAAMPEDPAEPIYKGNDTAGEKVNSGAMSPSIKKVNKDGTQANGVYDGNYNGRYADNNYFVYYYSLENLDTSRSMTLSLPLGGQYGIKVAVGSNVCPAIITTHNDQTNGNSWGGDAWTLVTDFTKEGGSGNGPNSAMRTYTFDPADFGEAINTATHIYFMFYDAVTPGGYGPRIALGRYENGQPVNPVTFTYHTITDVKGIASAALSLSEDFNITYSVGKVDTDATPIFSFTLGDDFNKVITAAADSEGDLVATFKNIMPYRLAETIVAKLYIKTNGVVHTFERTYSVKEYCENMLKKSTSAEFTALLNAILAYGDTAQDYVSYQTDAKPSTGIDGYVAPKTTYTPGTYQNYRAVTGTASVATWKSATLLLGSETMVAFTFEAADVTGLTVVVDGETVAYEALGNGLYRVEIPVMPNAYDEMITAKFAVNGTADDSYFLTYSAGSYFENKYEVTGEATRKMLDALYNYGTAAAVFAPAN